ncbi:hypothetical protein N7493_001669 [Penicillium malachiteum]|uniref:Uncharacterized protein n=1 Tax=Penicillium malachiteum TaxID=1324776 RepID=A0AAD6MZW8_9EURO|nr:hypothetical protein N7493_001669 [Penicillium malachiteum]
MEQALAWSHDEPVDDVAAASRAWRFFVREQWVDAEGDAVHEQRRALVELWATADQAFRVNISSCLDGIVLVINKEDRAINPGYQKMSVYLKNLKMYKITPPTHVLLVWIPESTTSTSVLQNGHPRHKRCSQSVSSYDSDGTYMTGEISMYCPLQDNQGDVLKTFKFRQSVSRPNFLDMSMTVNGTLLFWDCMSKLIIDDRTLETGLCLWVQYENNGKRQRAWRAQIFMEEFPLFLVAIHANSDPLEEALQYMDPNGLGDENPELILENDP